MSGALTLGASIIGGSINQFLFSPMRKIGDILPDISIEELHRDELRTSDHPVEINAAITDHAFKLPPVCDMRIGFSDTGLLNGPGYSKYWYNRLIALQNSRIPVTVSTGKRLYNNMLIISVATQTEEGSEFSAIILVRLKQIIIAVTTITSVPPAANQAAPATAAPTASTGQQQPAPVAAPQQSVLSRLGGLFGAGGSTTPTAPASVPSTPRGF